MAPAYFARRWKTNLQGGCSMYPGKPKVCTLQLPAVLCAALCLAAAAQAQAWTPLYRRYEVQLLVPAEHPGSDLQRVCHSRGRLAGPDWCELCLPPERPHPQQCDISRGSRLTNV